MKAGRTLLCLLIFFAPAIAAERLTLPDNIQYHRFASFVKNHEAVWANPAALADDLAITMTILGDISGGHLARDWGVVAKGDRVGLGYRRVHDFMGGTVSEYLFALGLELGHKSYLGGSYRYLSEGPGIYRKKHFWNLAFLVQGHRQLSGGALLSNLNRSRVAGEKTPVVGQYAITYRFPTKPLAVSAELTLEFGQSLSQGELAYGIELFLFRNGAFFIDVKETHAFNIGFRYNFDPNFAGGCARFDRNGKHAVTTLYGGSHLGSGRPR